MARRKLRHRSFDLYSAYSYFLPDWKGVLILLVMFIFGALLGNLFTAAMAACFKSWSPTVINSASQLVSYPIMFIPPMLYAAYQSRLREGFDNPGLKVDSSNFGYFSTFSIVLAVITAAIALCFVIDIFGAILPPMPAYVEKMMDMFNNGPLWITLISTAILAPIFEEWLCRGMILRGLLQHIRPVWAIVVSALFFALIHANLWQAIPAFCYGMVFGYVYYKTGSLKLTMLMHCTNNVISMSVGRISAFRDCNSFMDVMSTWSYVVLFILCALWVAYFILRVSRITVPAGRRGNFDPASILPDPGDDVPSSPTPSHD